MLNRRGLVLNLVAAAGQPVLVVGLLAGADHVAAHWPDSGWTGAVSVILLVLTGLTWLAGIVLAANPLIVFVGAVASMVAMSAVTSSIDDTALYDRGVRTICDVTAVDRRVETRSHYDANGTWSTSTTAYYDHRLRCDDGPIEKMTLLSRAAEAGQRLEITFDPLLKVNPVPADTVTDGSGSQQLALIATLVAVLTRVGGVLWSRW